MNQTGPGGIAPGNYDARGLTQDQRQYLFNYFGNSGDAPVGYGGQVVAGSAEDLTRKADAAVQAQKDLAAQQEAKQNEFLGRFQTAVGAQETLPDMATRIGGTLGLPGLQSTAQGLIKSVAQIPTVQTNATRGYNVNSNQLSQIIAAKQAQLAPAAQQAVTQEQAGEQALNTQLGYGVQQQQKDLLPLTTEGSMLSDQLAREMTGFTTAQSNQLSAYTAALNSNTQLTLEQLKDANALAQAHIQYDNTKQQIANNFTTLSPGNQLYQNGQLIATAPSALKASSDPY